jgi:CheY-like chemotaxis protein
MASRGTVLVVDDDADLRDVVVEALHARGYAVLSAENGADALKVIEAIAPSVILLDLSMPTLDGRGFLALRAQRPDLAAIPVIVASGSEPIPDAGVPPWDGVLFKPYGISTLVEVIERACKS